MSFNARPPPEDWASQRKIHLHIPSVLDMDLLSKIGPVSQLVCLCMFSLRMTTS